MNLTTALTQAAAQLKLDPAELIDYAAQDTHGGYPEAFPTGSMWQVEGQFLYSLIRALKPYRVLEIGTSHGCSATHMLQALHDNGIGHLTCVDSGIQVPVVGSMIPDELRGRVMIEQMDLYKYLSYPVSGYFDFIFEDAMHGTAEVEFIWRQIPRMLYPSGGVIVSHDAAHHLVGADVMTGIQRAGYTPTVYAIDPADCGFAVYQYEGVTG